ncbi:hypothetical protein LDENG_00074370 [Lucifuga dentata]|nr:hypothetical protein LDENG_00074370 [Lucifuga dentata]
MKLGSKLKWGLLRVDDGEACKPCRASSVKATIRKYIRREQKRAQLAKLKAMKVFDNRDLKEAKCEAVETSTGEFTYSHPGAMAPENTTQYLMNNVYDDLSNQRGNYAESVSASSETSFHIYDESLSPERLIWSSWTSETGLSPLSRPNRKRRISRLPPSRERY